MAATATVVIGGAGRVGPIVYSAVLDPTVDNDGVAGYRVGDTIINTVTAAVFTCVSTGTGAAVWSSNKKKVLTARTADLVLTRAMSGGLYTNLAAVATVLFTLPQDAVAGEYFEFSVMAAQELRVTPGAAGAIYINGAKQTDNKYISADDEGETVELVADGNGDWIARHATGTWTVQG